MRHGLSDKQIAKNIGITAVAFYHIKPLSEGGKSYRQFNVAYIEIGKKNGKSELAAGVSILLCCADNEERAEVSSKHGFNVSGVVFDELHARPNRKLFDVMTKGSGDAGTQPLYFLTTMAGNDMTSIGYETHQTALDILEGRKINSTFISCCIWLGRRRGFLASRRDNRPAGQKRPCSL